MRTDNKANTWGKLAIKCSDLCEKSKNQYRRAIDLIGLSQVKASVLFGVSRKQSPRWARGEAPIPGAVAKLLRLMIAREISPEEVNRLE
jgi:hypothetical protein